MLEMYNAYLILCKIMLDGQYLKEALNQKFFELKRHKSKINYDLVCVITYGVLERNIALEKEINKLCNNKPDAKINILLKTAMYCKVFLDSIPDYALVNNTVEIAQKIGKGKLKGFVNGVLRNFLRYDKEQYKQIITSQSKPDFLVKMIHNNYPLNIANDILKIRGSEREQNVRVNTKRYSNEEFKSYLDSQKIKYKETAFETFQLRDLDKIDILFKKGLITYQSVSSCVAARSMQIKDSSCLLDMCSAPGGKLILLGELADDIKAVAVDVHEHRLKLIKAYKKRMKSKMKIDYHLADGTKFNPKWHNKFDYVLVDVPCTGTGMLNSKPDILLRLKEQDVFELNKIQNMLLENAIMYVKPNGIILYSTCSILKEENENITDVFVERDLVEYTKTMVGPLEINGKKTLFPDAVYDGFYIARMRKK